MFENIKSDIATATSEAIRTALANRSSSGNCYRTEKPEDEGNGSGRTDGTSEGADGTVDIINSAIRFGEQATASIDRQPVGGDQNEEVLPYYFSEKEPTRQHSHDANVMSGETGPHVEDPSFSLGLSQEGIGFDLTTNGNTVLRSCENKPEDEQAQDEFDVSLQAFQKSKRPRLVPKGLVGEYACDVHLLNQARVAQFGDSTVSGGVDYTDKYSKLAEKLDSRLLIRVGESRIGTKEITQIVEMKSQLPAKIVDILMHHTRTMYQSQSSQSTAVFLDTKFVAQLGRCSAKFSKAGKKDSFSFPGSLCGPVIRESVAAGESRYYFPFNLDKSHWIGICADTTSWSLVVLDCNTGLRSDALMSKELKNIAVMFPFLLRQAGKGGSLKDTRPMVVERPRSVPQNPERSESAVTAVLLIQSHAVAGVEVCKCITPEVLHNEVQRLVVMMYEENVATL